MKKFVLGLATVAAWYVVTYSGQRASAPFLNVGECQAVAAQMAKSNSNISTVCRSFNN